MSFWGWISGAPKVVDDVFDKDNGLIAKAGSWVGNMNLTDEEVMEANTKIIDSVQKHVVNSLDENSLRSQSRRDIAGKIVDTYIFLVLASVVLWGVDKEYSEFILKLLGGWALGSAFAAIIVFHFGSYGLVRHNSSKAKK